MKIDEIVPGILKSSKPIRAPLTCTLKIGSSPALECRRWSLPGSNNNIYNRPAIHHYSDLDVEIHSEANILDLCSSGSVEDIEMTLWRDGEITQSYVLVGFIKEVVCDRSYIDCCYKIKICVYLGRRRLMIEGGST